jgi:pyruvate/2-oxoglutarate dehydrogenase complex dihydrolipoamide dehydrogenase (E3) component
LIAPVRQQFDALIVGAGQAGPPLAARLSEAGMRVALMERELFGGTCVNTGCTPTKTLVASARVAYQAANAARYGVLLDGAVRIDMATVKARKDAVVVRSRSGVESWLNGLEHCTVVRGHARFIAPDTLAVGSDTFSAPRIFLNVGGRAVIPPLPGIERVPYLTNGTLLELDHVPERLLIIGGSYIGLEFAQMFRRFGSRVTVIERSAMLLPREDAEVSAAIESILRAENIEVRTQAECISLAPHADGIAVAVDCRAGDPAIVGTHLLLAVGRRPNTDDLGIEAAGVQLDAHGYIRVDEQLQTNVAGIWALGDCNGRGAFTHTAYNDYEIVAANLLDGQQRRVSDRIPCYALYIDPPLGRVGLTETEARAAGHTVRVGNRPMTRVGRAAERDETSGFMKVIVDAGTDAILGAAILGIEGDEAIHGILDSMSAGATALSLAHTMHIHPTVSELIPTMLGELKP